MKFYLFPKRNEPAWKKRLLLAGAALLLAACTSTTVKDNKVEEEPDVLFWPSPPDLPRFGYETALRSAADLIEESENKRLARQFTGEAIKADPAFSKPYGIAARNGKIYITDTVSRSVTVFDVPRRKVYYMGLRDPGALAKPSGIALDKEMRVYVADVTARQVNIYDSLGLFLHSVGGPKDLERPTGVAVNAAGNRIYVIDRSMNEDTNHRVVVYDDTGRKLFVIGERGTGEGKFNVPVQGAVGPDGTLYVLDAGNFRVQAFDPDGKFLRAWGKIGNNLGDLMRPRGIGVDDEGNVYVTDAAFGNIQIFNSKGQLLMVIGSSGIKDRPGRYSLPGGVAVDETGRLYVTDQYFSKVEVFRRLTEKEGERIVRNSAH